MDLLRQVQAGEVSVEDARAALEGAALTREQVEAAVDHGVFNEPELGSVVRASMSPHGDSVLLLLFALWGVLWTLFWAGAVSYTHLTLPTKLEV